MTRGRPSVSRQVEMLLAESNLELVATISDGDLNQLPTGKKFDSPKIEAICLTPVHRSENV